MGGVFLHLPPPAGGGTPLRRAPQRGPPPGGAPPTTRAPTRTSEGRRGGDRNAHDPPRGSSAGRGAHQAPANTRHRPDPIGGAGARAGDSGPPEGAAHAPHLLMPRHRARIAPEHWAGRPTRTAPAEPAAFGGGAAGPPERRPVYCRLSEGVRSGLRHSSPPRCSLFIVHAGKRKGRLTNVKRPAILASDARTAIPASRFVRGSARVPQQYDHIIPLEVGQV